MTIELAPSILSANFARLADDAKAALDGGGTVLHLDVMDGHFVPNISMGAPIVASLRKVTRLPIETHLMIENPDAFLDEFVEAGSDSFIVHWEGNANLHRTVQRVKTLGKRVGVAINPATPAALLHEILPEIDQVLAMTVDPGFGHQAFLTGTLHKIGDLRQMINGLNPSCDLEVDGGIDSSTARLALAAGANVLVAGTSVFGNRDGVTAGIQELEAAVTLVSQ
jgi:ribulose-phosphate 3-epimerase